MQKVVVFPFFLLNLLLRDVLVAVASSDLKVPNIA